MTSAFRAKQDRIQLVRADSSEIGEAVVPGFCMIVIHLSCPGMAVLDASEATVSCPRLGMVLDWLTDAISWCGVARA